MIKTVEDVLKNSGALVFTQANIKKLQALSDSTNFVIGRKEIIIVYNNDHGRVNEVRELVREKAIFIKTNNRKSGQLLVRVVVELVDAEYVAGLIRNSGLEGETSLVTTMEDK